MEMYFLKSAACLAVLLLFYKLLLEKENMHVFKRFYLLTSVLAAIIIPLITFTSYIEPSAETFNRILISSEAASEEAPTNYLPYFLTAIYVLGALFFSIKFIRNLRNLILKIRKNPKIKNHNIINVLLSENIQPHTFFCFIFFNKQKYLNNEIPKDVKIHEEAHARQKHSLDVIFVELFYIVFWFNPLIFLLKNAIKLNHEFLADRAVIRQGFNTALYQQTLLLFSSGDLQSDLVNPINYSSIKKRFTVMKTQTSKKTIWARGLLILPLISILFFSFSNKEIVEKELTGESSNSTTLILEVDENGKIFFRKGQVEIAELQKYIGNGSYTSYHIEVAENSSPSIMKDLIQIMAENKFPGSVATCTTNKIEHQKATPSKHQYPRQDKKLALFIISDKEIIVNGQKTNLRGFVKLIDEATKNWTRADYNLHGLEIKISEGVSESIIGRLNAEFRKTKLADNLNSDSDYIPYLTNSDSPPPATPKIETYLNEDSKIYLDGKIISAEKALELVKKKRNELKISIHQDGGNSTIITMETKSSSF